MDKSQLAAVVLVDCFGVTMEDRTTQGVYAVSRSAWGWESLNQRQQPQNLGPREE
jgi:hypothetical protein